MKNRYYNVSKVYVASYIALIEHFQKCKSVIKQNTKPKHTVEVRNIFKSLCFTTLFNTAFKMCNYISLMTKLLR